MNNNDVVKMGLTQVHAMCDEVQSLGEKVIAYWAEVKDLHQDELRREEAITTCAKLSERALDLVTKASVLANCLCSSLEDRKQHNAVIHNALKELSGGYAKLLQMQKALEELMGDSE